MLNSFSLNVSRFWRCSLRKIDIIRCKLVSLFSSVIFYSVNSRSCDSTIVKYNRKHKTEMTKFDLNILTVAILTKDWTKFLRVSTLYSFTASQSHEFNLLILLLINLRLTFLWILLCVCDIIYDIVHLDQTVDSRYCIVWRLSSFEARQGSTKNTFSVTCRLIYLFHDQHWWLNTL